MRAATFVTIHVGFLTVISYYLLLIVAEQIILFVLYCNEWTSTAGRTLTRSQVALFSECVFTLLYCTVQ